MDERLSKLDPNTNSISALQLLTYIQDHLVGQEEAVKLVMNLYEKTISPLKDIDKPALFALFLGPSGVGKTTLAELIGEFLLDSYGDTGEEYDPEDTIITVVDCASYGERHEVSRVIGAPPGYIGYDDIPLLDQRSIDAPAIERLKKLASAGMYGDIAEKLLNQINMLQEETIGMTEAKAIKVKMDQADNATNNFIEHLRNNCNVRIWSVVLLDEFEKGHKKLHDLILPIISKGRTTLANNRPVNFRDSIVLMTSNAGSEEITNTIKGRGSIGFNTLDINKSIKNVAMRELKKIFRTEFLGRLGKKTVVFHALTKEQVKEVINMKIDAIKTNLAKKFPIIIQIDDSIYEYLLKESLGSPEHGVRLIESNIEDYLIITLSKLINSGEVKAADTVVISRSSEGNIEFYKEKIPDSPVLSNVDFTAFIETLIEDEDIDFQQSKDL